MARMQRLDCGKGTPTGGYDSLTYRVALRATRQPAPPPLRGSSRQQTWPAPCASVSGCGSWATFLSGTRSLMDEYKSTGIRRR